MQRVEIRAKGHLDDDWASWLEGFTFTHNLENETVLTGTVKDQAALYGLIAKLRDLGVILLAVNISTPRNEPQIKK
jgi:shikimate kinase